jgi:hypothetical protein
MYEGQASNAKIMVQHAVLLNPVSVLNSLLSREFAGNFAEILNGIPSGTQLKWRIWGFSG